MADQYEETVMQSRLLAQRMKMGTGASDLLKPDPSTNHYVDTLQRFQKDYAAYDKNKREQEKLKRQRDLERKRIEQLQRENRRWQNMEDYDRKLKTREQQNLRNQQLGVRRTANSNGLAYNPINLQYERNPQGQRLKVRDQDTKIRGYVRAHNMDTKGNCKYNLINGQDRVGIEKIIPNDLNDRYQNRLYEHYDNMRLKVPMSSNSTRSQGNILY